MCERQSSPVHIANGKAKTIITLNRDRVKEFFRVTVRKLGMHRQREGARRHIGIKRKAHALPDTLVEHDDSSSTQNPQPANAKVEPVWLYLDQGDVRTYMLDVAECRAIMTPPPNPPS
jgi:hypothetical protein